MVFSITEEYDKIWKKADELAELETEQYVKHPYTHSVFIDGQYGEKITLHRKYSRSEYKDDRRTHHTLDMLSVLMSSEVAEEK